MCFPVSMIEHYIYKPMCAKNFAAECSYDPRGLNTGVCAGPVEREFWTGGRVTKDMGQLFSAVMTNLRKLTCKEMVNS